MGAQIGEIPQIDTALLETMNALSHDIRLQILRILSDGEQDVSSLADLLELDAWTVSYHLRGMLKKSLVRRRNEGTRRIYGSTPAINISEDVEHLVISARCDSGSMLELRFKLPS